MLKRAFLASCIALALVLALGAQPVSAHAIVLRSEPADGAVLDTAPQQIRLWFSEPVALNMSAVELIDGAGRAVAVQGVHADAAGLAVAVRNEQSSAVQVMVDLPRLEPGVYRLRWRALSNTDLHATSGLIVFGVQHATNTTAVAALEATPSPFEVALRWADMGALLVLAGALALALLVLPRALRAQPALAETGAVLRVRLLALAEWAGVLALLGGVALLLLQSFVVAGPGITSALAGAWQIMSGTGYGHAWLLRQGALVALGMQLPLARRSRGRLAPTGLALAALVALLAQAFQGHAAAADGAVPLGAAASLLHLLGAGAWAGGLAGLALAVWPLARADEAARPLGRAMLRGFGMQAAAGMALLLLSGLALMARDVASPDALLTTLYGRALLLKLALVVIGALLGLGNAARLHARVSSLLRRLPVPARPPIWRAVRAEALVGGAVVLCAAVLAASQPARGLEFDPPAAEVPALATTHADDLVVTVALKPNRPGQNFIALGVFDTRRPAPGPIDEVRARLVSQGGAATPELNARPQGAGRYEIVDAALAQPGAWQLTVTVRRAGLPDATTTLPWTVLPPAQATRPVLISAAPLAPWAWAAALLAAALMALASWLLLWRRAVQSPTSTLQPTISNTQPGRAPGAEGTLP